MKRKKVKKFNNIKLSPLVWVSVVVAVMLFVILLSREIMRTPGDIRSNADEVQSTAYPTPSGDAFGIAGTIYDITTRKPIPGVKLTVNQVNVRSPYKVVTSDANGGYYFTLFPSNGFNVSAEVNGYGTQKRSYPSWLSGACVDGNRIYHSDFALAPKGVKVDTKLIIFEGNNNTGNVGGLAGADAQCSQRAASLKLRGNWKAWLSDGKTSASSRLTHHSGPYVTTDGTLIAWDWNDLTDGSLADFVQYGNSPWDKLEYSGVRVCQNSDVNNKILSNTTPQGDIADVVNNCRNWTSDLETDSGIMGMPSKLDGSWTQGEMRACSKLNGSEVNYYHLICIEQ